MFALPSDIEEIVGFPGEYPETGGQNAGQFAPKLKAMIYPEAFRFKSKLGRKRFITQ